MMARLGRGSPRSLSSNETVPTDKLCQPFCNPWNASGYCPAPCLNYCPNVCHKSIPPPVTPLPPPSTYNSPEVSSSSSVFRITTFAVISAAFIVTCVYGLLVWARQRRRRAGPGAAEFLQRDVEIGDDDGFLDEDRGPIIDHPIWYIRTVGLDASVIDGIAVCRYNRGEGLVEGTDCSVCLSEFQEDENLRLLPKCSHAFHIRCIDEWLRSRTNCPVCRAPVLAGGRQRAPDHIPEEPVSTSDLVDRGSMQGDDDADLSLPSDGLELDEGRKMQRSASVDSLSAAKISVAVSNVSRKGDSVIGIKNAAHPDQNLVRIACRNLATLSSSASSSSSMRRTRSLSWSGRFLSTATRYGQNRSTILPL